MKRTLASLAAAIAVGGAVVLASEPGQAADASASATSSSYQKERADCNAGRTAQDRATCLKEAGAAQDERKRNRLDNTGSARENAVARCNAVAAKDKADCLARIEGSTNANQRTTTSGSVAGGGVIRETTTTITGQPATPAPAAGVSAPR